MPEGLLVTLTLLGLVMVLIYKYLAWNLNFWNKFGVTAAKARFLYGTFPSALTGEQHIVYDLEKVYYRYKKAHGAVGTLMLRTPELLVLDPKLAVNVMVTNFSKFRDNLASTRVGHPDVDKYAARNPFFSIADEWKSRRAEGIGGLTPNKLNAAYPIWRDNATKMGAFLAEVTAAGDAVVETKNLAHRFTAAIMADFLLGIDVGTLVPDAKEPNTFLDMCMKWLEGSFLSEDLHLYLEFAPILRYFVCRRFYPEHTDSYFSNLCKEAIAMRSQTPAAQHRVDFLNYVLQLSERKTLSHDDIVGHILTVNLDGFETSGTVLAHTLFYLAKYPEVQQKLRTEILEHLEPDGLMSFDNLNSILYLEQCVNETMRMISPLPTFARICSEPTELDIGGGKRVKMQPGMVVRIPIFCYHHDPEYFPHPYTYQPERFDNGAHIELTKKGIFMPFGTGPRICLGMRVGLLEVKMGLVQILSRYRVKSCSRTIEEKRPDANTFIFGLSGDFWLEYKRL